MKLYEKVTVDADIDSNNDDGANLPDRSDPEDAVEDIFGSDTTPGKVILVNNGDVDNDGIVDWADGFGLVPSIAESLNSFGTKFVPLVLDFGVSADLLAGYSVEISYSSSTPADVYATYEAPFILPSQGALRLWNVDGSAPRDAIGVVHGGNFVGTGTYEVSQLVSVHPAGVGLLYVEAVRPSLETADQKISFTLRAPDESVLSVDNVRITATQLELEGRGFGETAFHPLDRLHISNLDANPESDHSYGFTPAGYTEMRYRLIDPRQMSRVTLNIGSESLILDGGGGTYLSETFLNTSAASTEQWSLPYTKLHLNPGSVPLQYNPEGVTVVGA